jgi:single-stranded DNA-binding protein
MDRAPINNGMFVIITGNLTADPVVSTTTNGKKVVKFTIAQRDGSMKGEDGQYKDITSFYNLQIWEDLYDTRKNDFITKEASLYTKGMRVIFKGNVKMVSRIHQDKVYTDTNVIAFDSLRRDISGGNAAPKSSEESTLPVPGDF